MSAIENLEAIIIQQLLELESLRQERDGLRAGLSKIKADTVRDACEFALQKARADGFFTIDSKDLLQYAKNIEAMAKEQGDE